MLDVTSIPAIPQEKPRRLVALRRDEMDFVVALSAEGIVFRNPDGNALRKVCQQLRWKIVSDTAYTLEGSVARPKSPRTGAAHSDDPRHSAVSIGRDKMRHFALRKERHLHHS